MKKQNGIKVETESSRVDARTRGHHSTMFPLWFLTWRKGDRVAYAVVNGESGKVVSDLPVDMKSFSLGCAVIALIVFVLLEMFVQPTPLITSVVSLIAAALMAYSIRKSTKRIFEKQTHEKDKGWTGAKDPVIKEENTISVKNLKKIGRFSEKFMTIGLSILVIAVSYFVQFENIKSFSKIAAIAVVFFLLVNVVRVLGWQRSIPQWQPSFAILAVMAAVVLNAAIVFINPANDLWYYLGDAACILILIIASAVMLKVYNIGTTRPLPRLFDREEVR